MDAKEEVRSRLNIEDVVGEYVQLKRAGRSWKGLSPFSGEKTPSFFVSPDKQIWHDFSSNKGGDVYAFVMEVEGLDFRGALELLARKAGVDLSLYESKGSQDLSRKKSRLLKALSEAADFYQRRMVGDARAREYVVSQRGLNRQMVEDFKIGYAPRGGEELTKYLLGKGFTRQEIKDAGLIGSRGTDMFRDRMTVALADASGQTIGFTARLIDKDANGPKYINTPQTLVYDKGRHVFGLHLAKEAIRTNDYAVIVEGNIDVITSHQVGVRQVVATAGTALTEFHLKALARLTHNVRLSFDGDKAGIAATERAIPIAQNVGVELSVISYEGAKDPDELIKKDPKLWESAIATSKPALEWLINQYAARVDVTTAAGKRELTTQAFAILSKVADPIEQEHYLKLIARITDISEAALRSRLEQFGRPEQKRFKPIKAEVSHDKDIYGHEDFLLALMTCEPAVHDVTKKLTVEELHGEERSRLFTYLSQHPAPLRDDVPEVLKDIDTYVKIVLFKAETRYSGLDDQDRLVEAVKLVRQIKEQKRKQTKQVLTEALREAESRGDTTEVTRLQQELNYLIKEEARAQRSYKR